MLNTPVDRIRCSLVGELRVPARVSSLSVLPSPLSGRVGVHITTFEACSSFTRVTACRVAHPPFVGFIARLRPGQFPDSDARKLPSSTNNLLGWVLPPLVICAVEAHPISPFSWGCRKEARLATVIWGPHFGAEVLGFELSIFSHSLTALRRPQRHARIVECS